MNESAGWLAGWLADGMTGRLCMKTLYLYTTTEMHTLLIPLLQNSSMDGQTDRAQL